MHNYSLFLHIYSLHLAFFIFSVREGVFRPELAHRTSPPGGGSAPSPPVLAPPGHAVLPPHPPQCTLFGRFFANHFSTRNYTKDAFCMILCQNIRTVYPEGAFLYCPYRHRSSLYLLPTPVFAMSKCRKQAFLNAVCCAYLFKFKSIKLLT